MFLRRVGTGLIVLLVAVAGGGCKKEAAPVDQQPIAASNKNSAVVSNQNSKIEIQDSHAPLLRIHWLGKKRLATETNAAYFMTIWNLPESGRLEAQTLDKLALWLANARPALSNYQEITNYAALVSSNAAASTLRPLVQDLVQEEWLLEIQQPTNQPVELALAIRLDEERNAAWQAAQGVLGEAVKNVGHQQASLRLTRSGAWTLLGVSESPGTNSQLPAFSSQLAASGNPFPERATNYWLEANVDLLRLAGIWPLLASFNYQLSTNWPTINFLVIGDGENVRTRAQLDFPQPLNLELDPWNVPTNLIHDPLIGFTAIRGIRPLLKNFKPWNDLQLGTPPNQAYFWANQGPPQYHFAALPSAEASVQVNKLASFVLSNLDPIFASNPLNPGGFVPLPLGEGLRWRGIPLFSPALDCLGSSSNRFIFAGYSTNQPSLQQPIPQALLAQVYGPTNLCFYDWEVTGSCLYGLTPMAQLSRRAFNLPRLPAEPSISWLLALSQRLVNSGTMVKREGASRISLVRRSSFGLTAAEIQLLTDWLQSPEFPCGFHTLSGR